MQVLKRYYLALILLLSIFLLISLAFPLLSYQEARRAVIIQESFFNKSLLPTYNGEPYFTKPPLHTWLSLPLFAMGYSVGLEIFSLRLLSFLSYFLTGYLLYLICERDSRKTLLTLLILFSSYRFFSFIYRLDLEPLFILFSTGALYFLVAFLKAPSFQKALLFYLAMALAFLVRGPLNFFWFPALLVYGLFSKNRLIWRLLFFLPGWGLLSGLILSWFLWGYLSFGKEVFITLFSTDIGDRLLAKRDPFYYYFKAFLMNFFPYLLIFLLKVQVIVRRFKEFFQYPQSLYFSLFFIPLLLLSFTGEKFDKYLLFLYPIFSLFSSQILLSLVSLNWLFRLGISFVFLNFVIIAGIQIAHLDDIRFKGEAMAKNINPKGKYAFYLESNPFILFLIKRPVPVLKDEKEIPLTLKEGVGIFSPKELQGLTPKKIFPDPYKKGKYWYLYNLNQTQGI